jgi:predicted PurR-regulated permease PerM
MVRELRKKNSKSPKSKDKISLKQKITSKDYSSKHDTQKNFLKQSVDFFFPATYSQETIKASTIDSLPKQGLQKSNKRFKLIFASILVVGLLTFLATSLKPYLNAFLGAFVVYFLFRSLYKKMVLKKIYPYLSASLLLLLTLLLVITPIFFGAKLVFNEISSNPVSFSFTQELDFLDEWFPQAQISDFIKEKTTDWINELSKSLTNFLGNMAGFVINLIIFFFTLFYLFIDGVKLSSLLKNYSPFNKKNTQSLVSEFKTITNSTVVATGLIGLLQGIFMALGFYIFGLPNPVLWGFVSIIMAILPVVGISVVWIPAVLFKLLIQSNIPGAIGIGLWGAFLANIDYVFLRPWIQKKMGKIHPLTTLVGIFIGIPVFGILGLILGPLLLSYMILITKMYVEEFLIH